MADGYIRTSPDSSGKRLDTSELIVASNMVERQRFVLADPNDPASMATIVNGALNVNVVSGVAAMAGGNGRAAGPFAVGDGYIQVPPDGAGKRLDTSELLVGSNLVERQRMVLADPSSAANLLTVTGGAINVNIVSGGITYTLLNVPSSTNPTFDWSQSVHQRIVLTSNALATFVNPNAAEMTVIIAQDAIGGWNVIWGPNIKADMPLDTTANTSSVFKFIYDGSSYLLMSSMGGM